MDKVANLPADHRRELFQETAMQRGINPAVAEKDFWVCWVLKQLFADPELGKRIVFKGGTTLSKVFGLIERFSEDIDLILDWRLLGYGPKGEDPYQNFDSKSKQDRFNKQFNQKAAVYIAGPLIHDLNQLLGPCSGISVSMDSDDPYTVNVVYPASFSQDYLRPEVRLEIGPLASWVPSAKHMIRPFAADAFPKIFEHPGCPVIAINAERSFWEKATILHQQAHRRNVMPSRYSRHYYDLYKMATSPVRDSALADLKLLEDVVAFKMRFYPSGWAKYEDAKPGSFKLVPADHLLADLRKDYRDMAVMILGPAPDFDSIIETLNRLEERINGLSPTNS